MTTRLLRLLAGALVIVLAIAPSALYSQQLAFPTAEGSGRFSLGGRGGEVYEVTNLTNSGPGSIVDAVSQGNRTIVFRVSGTIEMGDILLRPKSNTTIAGQTAPGDGICIKGRIYFGSVSDVVIRYVRVRVDAGAANSSGDAIDIDAGTNIMIDHVSASYARDEGISCQETSDSVTVQWCIISESLTFESHSYGSLVRGDYGDEKSYHHNLYVHNNNRLPRPGNYTATATDPEGLHFDFRNNVIYNWKGSEPGYNADVTATSRYNIIGNAYLSGPESTVRNTIFKESCRDAFGYFADNSYNGVVPADPWSMVVFSSFDSALVALYKARSYLVPMAPVTTTSPAKAQEDVLALAGACIPVRDTIDRRLVKDVLQRTGHSIATTAEQPEGGWPVLNSVPAPVDDDHDGMPNEWELAHALNPNDPTDRNGLETNGYTHLETYLNTLTGEVVTGVEGAPVLQPGEFSLEQNYPNPFNPVTVIKYTVGGAGSGLSGRDSRSGGPESQGPGAGEAGTRGGKDGTRDWGLGTRKTRLVVYDVLGRQVATLVDEVKAPGSYEVHFDARRLASGVYFYRLTAGSFVQLRTMILLK